MTPIPASSLVASKFLRITHGQGAVLLDLDRVTGAAFDGRAMTYGLAAGNGALVEQPPIPMTPEGFEAVANAITTRDTAQQLQRSFEVLARPAKVIKRIERDEAGHIRTITEA
jgi:hypothetical protein